MIVRTTVRTVMKDLDLDHKQIEGQHFESYCYIAKLAKVIRKGLVEAPWER